MLRLNAWSDHYIQHSAHIEPGRDGLFNLVRASPDTLRYENQLILAEGDYVIAHGRFSGIGREVAWIAADIVRFEDGKLAEHWDVLQDEATKAQSKSGRPATLIILAITAVPICRPFSFKTRDRSGIVQDVRLIPWLVGGS
jgi:predicted SnoaL-like aldol condensation-catalyzing enzyme